jgi:eukaryotic-like serine/threonine-protein kinase
METRAPDPPPDEQARLEALVGRVLGDKFRLRACIGIGGSGAVFRADQTTLGRTVAVKILSAALATDPRLVRRFQDEALAASRLNHPNTVSVIDYGQSPDGLLYIVMEYVKGPTLTQLVAGEHPLPIDRVLDIIGQILAGIEEAHLAGVVHADLKSDNVIVDQRRPDWDVVKVVDFGIARLVNQPREGEDRTICGTPEYMAPETITGAPPAVASDLYAVGVIFYELLCGETPFVGGNTVEILTRQLRHTPVPPGQRRVSGEVPPEVEAVCMRALAKHPGDRYPDAAHFRQAVRALREGRRGHSTNLAVCSACGANIPMRFRFCPECGQPRTKSAEGLEPAPTQQPGEPAEPVELPLIGRDGVIDAVVGHLTQAGSPAVLHLSGAAGAGKSRILREAYRRATAAARVTIYQSGPDPSGLASPLYPVRAAVAAVLALPAVCTLDELGRAATEVGLSPRDLPGLAELFGHPGSLSDLEPPVRRREMIAGAVRALQAGARDRPMAMVFEDVDDYDQPSQELLRRLCERSSERPALRVILTSRPELAGAWQTGVQVELEPLGAQALAGVALELHRAGLGEAPRARTLAALTRGMASHLEHLVRYLHEGGSIGEGLATVADLVAARVSLLPQPALALAQTLAVFGLEAERQILARAADVGPRALEATLSVLQARQLVVDDGTIVAFTTALVRDIVYDATPADVRRRLHGTAADLLGQVSSDPSLLGHHHEMAGHPDEAADQLLRAGDRAAYYLDDLGACALYQRALGAARSVLYRNDEDRDVERYTQLSIRLAEALCASGQLGLARGVLEEARPWIGGAPRAEAMIARTKAHIALGGDDLPAAIALVHRAIGQAIPTGDGSLLAALYLDLASVLSRAGDPDTARRELEEGIDLVTLGEGMTAAGGPPELWRMLLRIAQLTASGGDHARAVVVAEHALAHARRVGSRLGSARVQVTLASECDRLGQHEAAAAYREAAIDQLRALGDRRSTAELILSVVAPTRTLMRISPPVLQEARTLAAEVGWLEGAVVESES